MRLGYPVQNHRTIVITVVAMACALFLGYEAHSRWAVVEGVNAAPALSSIGSLRLIKVVSDLAAMAACLFACAVLARAAWKLRQQISFGTTGYVLGLVAITVCAKRLIDVLHVRSHLDGGEARYALTSAVISVLIACSIGLLVPFIQKIANFGLTASVEHDKFLTLAENTGESFCLLESVHNALTRIVDFRFTFVNSHAEKLLQRRNEDLVGRHLSEVLPQIRTNGILDLLRQVTVSNVPYMGEIKDIGPDGTGMWCTMKAVKIHGGLAIMLHDLSVERERQKRIEELNRFSQSLIEDAPFSIIAISSTGIVTAMNSAAEQLTKYRRHELTGKHSIVVLHDTGELSTRSFALSEETGAPVVAGFETLTATLRQRKSNESEWTYICKDGSRIAVHLALTVLRGAENEITGYLAVAFDISERKRLSDSISFLAHHDALTKLPNRMMLNQRMGEAIERAKALDQQIAIVMVDVDHFKRINDSLGHQAGDELLIEVSERLLSAVRKTDTVARAGGDEFVVLMPNSGSRVDTLRCVNRILEKVQMPITVAGRELSVTASVGVCVYPDWGADPVSLLRNADAAMYAAKDSGRNSYQVFSNTMLDASADRLELETDLRHALEKDEMFVVYQPQVHCKTGEIVGIEALLRWNHPGRGLVSPADFIPAAEDCGLILPIGQWVLRRACEEAKQMQDRVGHRFTVAINLSPRQFLQTNLAEMVENALQESGLAAEDLELEITEYTLMISSTETSLALGRLRELGVRIAIDDFGTGFSSFKYILEYEVDRLKIDRSFIAKCPHDSNATSIVRTVIAMAHGLRMKVVAEGVETEEQAAFLTRRHCDEAQGYLFGRPMPMDEVVARMAESRANRRESAANKPVLELAATSGV
jgi:diguanylate cyclase (GGDEF)-like protein/PAS domain S-box-containing protein